MTRIETHRRNAAHRIVSILSILLMFLFCQLSCCQEGPTSWQQLRTGNIIREKKIPLTVAQVKDDNIFFSSTNQIDKIVNNFSAALIF